MKKTLSIIINARMSSSRIKNKVYRKFHKTTLIENTLDKIKNIDNENIYLAVADKKLIDLYYKKYSSTNIKLIKRDPDSIKGTPEYKIIFSHYKYIKTTHIMTINCCLPFVKINTYKNAIRFFFDNNIKSLAPIVKKHNLFLDKNKQRINNNNNWISTNRNDDIYELSHAFFIFDLKKWFKTGGILWDYSYNNPYYLKINDLENFDIDNPIDFILCEKLFKLFGNTITLEKINKIIF
jgi:CMP-N-acetylneuraminic acid synthetase